MNNEKGNAKDRSYSGVNAGAINDEQLRARGRFRVVCRDADGKLVWETDIHNVVTTQGKNEILDQALEGAAFTAAWFMGLISSVGWAAVAAGDTAAQINGTNGWKEAGPTNAPNYTGNRPAVTFANAAAGSKATDVAITFAITASGTLKGCFLVTTNIKDATTGKILSCGAFSDGDKPVANGYTLSVSYSLGL